MSDLTVQDALVEIIYNLILTPRQPIAVATTVGATTVQVADASRFSVQGIVWPFDGTPEEHLSIASIDMTTTPHTITLDFTGVGYTGWQYAHAQGVSLVTNLDTEIPMSYATMLGHGDPVIAVFVLQDDEATEAQRKSLPRYTAHIEYRRSILQSQDNPMNASLWARRQQRAARQDLQTIALAILNNNHLITSTGPNAQGLGDGSRPILQRSWRTLIANDDNQQFAAGMDVVIRGTPVPLA